MAPELWNDWRWQFQNRIRTADGLAGPLALRRRERLALGEVTRTGQAAVTPYYFSLLDTADPADPIRRQCVPDPLEITMPGGVDDPLGEQAHSPVPGLIHRFRDRCLVIATNRCAVYCRHCNRRRLWRQRERILTARELEAAAAYIERRPSLREVILSGGDPLTLSDGRLERMLGRLRAIGHVEVLRIGSRAPVVLPMRVTERLCGMLRRYRPLWLLTQFNHPREITPEAGAACARLLEAGIPVLNQSVLLRGVNDDYRTMRELLYGLERIAVKPYYLFQCEDVKGTAHFRVDVRDGMRLMEKLWKTTSGVCLPRYVADMPGTKGKVPLQPASFL
ncbi:MAG: KamA family radical SAM protein [Syntrophaceae bacterium]|nr:KamA family radical SAM protein [Syntrophaceae bacterium]